jgi:hypothetical protein
MTAAFQPSNRSGSLAIFAAIRRASSLLSNLAAERRCIGMMKDLRLFLVGLRRQAPKKDSQPKHDEPRLDYMLHQKRQAAQRQQPAHCYFVPQPTNCGSFAKFVAILRASSRVSGFMYSFAHLAA